MDVRTCMFINFTYMYMYIIQYIVYICRALKKLNEKKQVFNMYKTQKAKEEKVTCSYVHVCILLHYTCIH